MVSSNGIIYEYTSIYYIVHSSIKSPYDTLLKELDGLCTY